MNPNEVEFRKRLTGGLNKATNLNEVPPTDFIDGYDIVDNSPKAYNEKGLLQPCSNTKLAYDLGEAAATYKKYRISIDLTGLASCTITFSIQIKGLISRISPFSYTSGTNAASTLVIIQSLFSGETITPVTISGFTLVFDIEFSSTNIFSAFCYTYTDYFMTVYNSLGDVYSCETRVDAVSPDKVGIFYPSCFANINNDQQIFSTTNNKKPEILSATVPITANGVFFTFLVDPLISDGEEVYVYPVSNGSNQIAGSFILQKESSNYTIVGVRSEAIGASGDYYVIRNYRTLSSIGYATKNDIIDQWNYTELLRSNKLNFRLYKQIQGALDITSDGIIYDWTDFLNTPRRLIHKGSIVENGFLTTYNADAYYDLDNLNIESTLQLGTNTSKVKLSITSGAGGGYAVGVKKEACYAAFVRFKTQDGAYTTYSKASNVLWLHSSSAKDHAYGLNSGLSLTISIEQIDTFFFSEAEVGIIEFTSSSWIGYSLPSIQIGDRVLIGIIDNGEDSESYLSFNAAATLLEQIPFVFENAKSILSYTNYRLLANVNLYQEYDLTDWAQTIQLTAKYRSILIGSFAFYALAENTYATILRGINDYSKCSNEWMSYMPYDHYRYCIFIDWINGSPTSTYWMGDLSFDPADTVLDSGDAVTIGDPLDTYSILQYYLEATNINLNYVLPDGKLLKEVVKDIRFGRALCNPQVQTTGFGMSVYNDGSNDYVSGFVNGGNSPVDTKLALYSADFQNTQRSFNWSDGDELRVKLIEDASSTTTSTSNVGVVFIAENLGTSLSIPVTELINVESQSINPIALYKYSNSGDIYIRNSAAVSLGADLDVSIDEYSAQLFYYLKPYGSEGAYPESPTQTRFFVIPQDQWFNKDTHDETTIYSIYGGDAFPTLSAYKVAENETDQLVNNAMFSYWHFNRTNAALRSGRFPFYTLEDYLKSPYLINPLYEGDNCTYDNCFTPRYIFQNQVAFNPLLPQFTNKFSSLYYSNQGFGSDNAGGNRIWLPLDMKVIETKYGAIIDIDVLLGQTGTNILIVLQERRVTAQYFDNTANIKSNTGELLIGNGAILEREGQNFTEFGCEHKQTAIKGKSNTGKDIKFWLCLRKTAIMRFGADGTSNIIGNIAPLIEERSILGLFNGYNNDDEPAFFNGIHAVWDNKRMEYILTLRLMPKTIAWSEQFAQKGDFKADPELKWGFEQFPVIYKSLKDTNDDPVTDPTAWTTYQGYDSGYFEILTIVWNEENNVFKTYRTYSPKIYGQFNDNYVSSHPTQGNLIFEHNDILSEAIYYQVETETGIEATTDPTLFRITGAGIESSLPSPFVPYERQKYIVTIEGKNYEVVGTGTNYLQMAKFDSDDTLPQVTIENFSYSVANCQDPYITGLCNNPEAKYFHFGNKLVQADSALKRTEYEAGFNGLGTAVTKGYSVKAEEKYQNGTFDTQIRQDTTDNPDDNKLGKNKVEGVWMKFKNVFRWGKNNKVLITIIKALQTQKTK